MNISIIIKEIAFYEIIHCPEYLISKCGKIYSTKKNKLVKTFSYDNYCRVSVSLNGKQKTFYLHRLIAQHFIENPQNKKEVNHIDGNKCNNAIDNLEWVSHKENIHHAINTGLIKYNKKMSIEEKRIRQSENLKRFILNHPGRLQEIQRKYYQRKKLGTLKNIS